MSERWIRVTRGILKPVVKVSLFVWSAIPRLVKECEMLASFEQAFTMFEGLFATIAYRGALGIIFAVPVWVSAFCSFIVVVADDDNACLNLGRSSTPKSAVLV